MRCPQRFAYHEILGLQPREEKPALARGSVFHEAARAYYLGEDWEAAVQALPRRYYNYVDEGTQLFRRYAEHYAGEAKKVLDVERELVVHLGGSELTRRVDLVVSEYRRGQVFAVILDHKLAARMQERVKSASDDWTLATQAIVGEKLSQRTWGLPFGGVVLNAVQTDGSAFHRQKLVFRPRMLETIPRSIRYYYDLEEQLAATRSPWNYPRTGDCYGTYGRCDYKSLCDYGQSAMGEYEGKEAA